MVRWQACEVLKGLPEQRVIADNGVNGHRKQCKLLRCMHRSGAEVRWFAGLPLIAVRNQPCMARADR